MPDRLSNDYSKSAGVGTTAWSIILLLFATAIGLLLLTPHPKVLKIYLVGAIEKMNDPNSTGKIDRIANAFQSRFASNGPRTFGGIPLKVIQLSDNGDPGQAAQLVQKLADAPDTLLVVGHGKSASTKAALPIYLESAKPAIPVITTTDTNPDLLPPNLRNDKDNYYPVFRLSPTDEDQAKKAGHFAIKHGEAAASSDAANDTSGTQRFWVVQDVENQNKVYSQYLAEQYIDFLHKSGQRVLLWSTNLDFPDPAAVQDRLRITWVLFAGTWRNALILIRRLNATLGSNNVRIILSDSSMDPALLSEGGHDVEGVYLTALMDRSKFDLEDSSGDYGTYGRDASMVVEQLLTNADSRFVYWASTGSGLGVYLRRFLGRSSKADARNALIQYMRDSTTRHMSFEVLGGDKGRLVFNTSGIAAGITYHVWKIVPDPSGELGENFVQVE